MEQDETKTVQDNALDKSRSLYGLLAVIISNVAIAGVAIFGVWRLDGDKAVIVGVLTAAFTAVSSMTTAYLGIKAVSNTAKSMVQQQSATTQAQSATSQAQAATSQAQAAATQAQAEQAQAPQPAPPAPPTP
ncbi:hypothetical protein [Streptomyces fulvoviolaceus]|uniref:hypothetical protein n=1 Tax=Streptomyces fulvoviolaceus TaxID=285535 RepID=UPI000A4C32B6|nr:hypothetical protein [Streptomyces fulvoviolaceus]MCT9079677.1 hypothetical protein [Streptomyces fulvoviolaceus]